LTGALLLPCAAADAGLDICESERLISRGRVLERPLAKALEPLAGPLVGVRAGLGALAGIDVAAAALARDRGLPARLQRLAATLVCWSGCWARGSRGRRR
jgi:putrescine---pyruvate transaminase